VANTLWHLAYVSTETRPLAEPDLIELLAVSRQRNSENGVTGLLLHREDSFCQVLEGNRESVRSIFELISRDPRHNRIQVMFDEPIADREFADWQMAFLRLTDTDLSALSGYSDFMSSNATPREYLEQLTEARRLLLLFRQMS